MLKPITINNTKTMEEFTAKDHEIRNKGIGGSDIGVLMGLSHFATPYDIWESKTGRREPKPDNKYFKSGRRLEKIVVEYFEEETGFTIIEPDRHIAHVDHPWCLGMPDRYFQDKDKLGMLECKTTQLSISNLEGVPLSWVCQLTWYAGIKKSDRETRIDDFTTNYIAWLTRGLDFSMAPVEYDHDFFERMLEIGGNFWNNNVLKDAPPDPVNSEDVIKMFPSHLSGKIINARPEMISAIEHIRTIKDNIRSLNNEKDPLEEQIKLAMLDAEIVMAGEETLVTWKKTKDGVDFDLKKFSSDHADLFKEYTSVKPGVRKFLVK